MSKKPRRWFRVSIDDVLEIPAEHHDSELGNLKQNEYVLVYVYPNSKSLHTVYVQEYDASTKTVKCINSHGDQDQFLRIRLNEIVKLYRVGCSAVDATTESGKPGIQYPNLTISSFSICPVLFQL